jgi:N-acetylglucosaminyl-diphospho-decaprenol L-rhamnosyltransferase
MHELGIVIVNYKTRELLRDCLRSIYDSEGSFSFTICVVDNASGDGTPALVRREFPDVDVIAQEENRGYAFANNVGLRRLGFDDRAGAAPAPHAPPYLLLLNPDTLLPPDSLRKMLAFMERHPGCGAAGPRLVRPDGSLDRACRRSFPTPEVSFYRLSGLSRLFPKNPRFGRYNLSYLDHNETVEVDSVVGAFMMMRREALSSVGLLDPTFFMYGEDLDLAYRMKAAGWKVWYVADVVALHYKGESSRQRSNRSIWNFYHAMYVFHRKHYAATLPAVANLLIQSGIWTLCTLALTRNMLRKPERRRVASAV